MKEQNNISTSAFICICWVPLLAILALSKGVPFLVVIASLFIVALGAWWANRGDARP